MAQTMEGAKPEQKNTVSWFEFLFDTTGDLLKKHLGEVSAEPSATQLIVQFLENSGLFNGATSETPPPEKKGARHLCLLALRAATHLQWNLDILEENLSLQWQNILLGELIKTAPALEGELKIDTDISNLDQKTAMVLIIYYRWVVRTLSQHFLPNVGKPTNNGITADNLANENILRKLEEQLPTAIGILTQALQVIEDMDLPAAPSLLSDPKKTEQTGQEKASGEAGTTSEEGAESMQVDIVDNDKAKSESDAKNGSDDCNGSNTVEKMDTATEEVFKVKKEDIIAQVSFDLGTLYFYQEKFQEAMKLFENCKNAQCCQSSFYTVNEKKLYGYYMACCGLTGIPPVITSAPPLAATKPSLAVRLEHCRHSGYNDIISVLLEDNISFELPLEYRENLVTELRTHSRRMSEDEDSSGSIPLDWQIMVCNIIRDILEGRPANPGFWLSLENCSQNQLEVIFSLCLQSVPVEDDFHPQGIKDSNRFKVLKSFIQLICCNCELVNGWEIARKSAAKVFLDEEKEAMDYVQNALVKTQQENLHWIPVNAQYNTEASTGQESIELKKGLLCNKLRHTVDPGEISTLVEQLHEIEKGRKHSEEFVCLLYKSHLEEIKNLQQQDILHILFSKALHCSAVQEYDKASQLLSYALGMVNTVAGRGAVSSPLERVKAAIHQELLVLDICHDSHTKRADEIANRVKSYIWQTAPGAAEIHIEEQVNAFLLNGKEWEFLSEIRVDENAQFLDHRSLSSLLASTCYLLSKPQGWRKPARSLWDGILKVFSNNIGQQKRPADGSQRVATPTPTEGLKLTTLIHFVRKIKEETVLTVLISCLVRLRNASNKGDEANNQREISSSHSHLWPTAITNPGNVNFDHIGLALSGVVHHALSVQHHNVSWLQTLGDIYLDSGNYSSALRCYLEAGAVSSFFFNSPVPPTVWDDQVYRKMVTCCSAMKAHIQAALLCQCMEVKDYTTAFKALQQASSASSDAMDFYYSFFWDITMLEYLTYTHAKRGQNDKKLLTIQAISQPDLNIFNTSELLQHTEQSRKAKLLRTLAKQYL
ncbi:integrator complex subunit 8-like isoform X2 [Oculina patagonica]